LTDVIQAVKEEKVAYIVETFGRPQVAIVDVSAYRRLQATDPQRAVMSELAEAAFGMWREREDMDEAWLSRSRRQWYSTWQEAEDSDE
jgi:PHD/YefM family antitoxin component YafN of YafNO toxin-antitoxin module